jgi:predicted DNA-binding transcriptional regulator YafY
MLQTIIDAIRDKQQLSFTYDGLLRLVEPHTVGLSTAGNQVMRCFQVGGSHRKAGHDWDLVKLEKIVALTVTGEHFAGPRPGYKRGDGAMSTIYAEL